MLCKLCILGFRKKGTLKINEKWRTSTFHKLESIVEEIEGKHRYSQIVKVKRTQGLDGQGQNKASYFFLLTMMDRKGNFTSSFPLLLSFLLHNAKYHHYKIFSEGWKGCWRIEEKGNATRFEKPQMKEWFIYSWMFLSLFSFSPIICPINCSYIITEGFYLDRFNFLYLYP